MPTPPRISVEAPAHPGPAVKDGFGWAHALQRQVSGRTVSQKQLLLITNQLAVMLSSGCDLCAGLDAMSRQQGHPYLREVLSDLHDSVRQGKSFSQALARHPQVFNHLYVTMVRAGESAGLLKQMPVGPADAYPQPDPAGEPDPLGADVPDHPHERGDHGDRGDDHLRAAQVRPGLQVVQHAPLPASTQFVLGMTEGISKNWIYIVPTILGVAVGLAWLLRHPAIRPTTPRVAAAAAADRRDAAAVLLLPVDPDAGPAFQERPAAGRIDHPDARHDAQRALLGLL